MLKLLIIFLIVLAASILTVPVHKLHLNSNQSIFKNESLARMVKRKNTISIIHSQPKCYCFYDATGILCKNECKKVFYIKHWRTYLPIKQTCLNRCSFTFIEN